MQAAEAGNANAMAFLGKVFMFLLFVKYAHAAVFTTFVIHSVPNFAFTHAFSCKRTL
jgi:hypothetical protein